MALDHTHTCKRSFFALLSSEHDETPDAEFVAGRDNMVTTGVPLMFDDRTGSLSGSEFVELHDRIYLRVRCTRRDPDGASQYGVYNMRSRHDEIPVATFGYGAGGTLGNITMIGAGGLLRTQAIAAFLVEAGGPRHRKFTASDGHEYSWSFRTGNQDLEWSCVNSSGQTVAWYAVSNGRAFGVEEPYPHLAVDFLTTLMIMRHIAARNM